MNESSSSSEPLVGDHFLARSLSDRSSYSRSPYPLKSFFETLFEILFESLFKSLFDLPNSVVYLRSFGSALVD